MTSDPTRSRLFSLVSLSLAIALTGCSGLSPRASSDYSVSAPWSGYDQVVIRTRNGAVDLTIDPQTGGQAIASGRKSVAGLTLDEATANLERVQITMLSDAAAARTLRIELAFPPELQERGPSASVNLRIPAVAKVDVQASNGSIRTGPVAAGSRFDTSNGSVHVEHAAGDVAVESSNGGIHVQRCDGSVFARTSNSSITVVSVAGDADLQTGNGPIKVGECRGRLTADTSNGRIEARAWPSTTTPVRLDSSNGSIHVTVPRSMSGLVELDTSNGSIELIGEPVMKIRTTSKSHLVAAMNDGDQGGLHADTSNGAITVVFE
jgi:DUF4097 and DUF4098 domain-containing protein YvlB